MDTGYKLKIVREEKGLSQVDVAEKLGLSQKTISSWEKGRTNPKFGQLTALCKIYGCTYEYLTGIKQHNSDDITVDDILFRIESFDIPTLERIKTHLDNLLYKKKEYNRIIEEKQELERRLSEYNEQLKQLRENNENK